MTRRARRAEQHRRDHRRRPTRPRLAQDLANGFAEASSPSAPRARDGELDEQIPRLRERSAAARERATAADELARRSWPAGGAARHRRPHAARRDPRGRAGLAVLAAAQLTIIAAVFAGLILGIGGAFALHALDPRLRREEQLRELYSLPILARVPKERQARRPSPRGSAASSASARATQAPPRAAARASCRATTLESFRTLRTMLAGRSGARRRQPLDPRHRAVAVRGQDDHGDQPRLLARAGGQPRDPDRGRLPPPDRRRGAGRPRPTSASATCCSATWRSRTPWCRRRRSATTCGCCWSTAPTTGSPRCSRSRRRGPARGGQAPGRLRRARLAAAHRGHRRDAARPAGRRRRDGHAPGLEQPRRSSRTSGTCSIRTASSRPASWSSAWAASEEQSYYRGRSDAARASRTGSCTSSRRPSSSSDRRSRSRSAER